MNADQIIAEFRVIPATAQGLSALALGSAYIDGELCALRDDGTTSFSAIQAGTDSRSSRSLIYFAFDLLFLDGTCLMRLSLIERKTRLESVLAGAPAAIRFSEHVVGDGSRFHEAACKLHAEGIVSKRMVAPYIPDNRGLWQKAKWLNREEFIVVGFTDPEGSRPYIGSLLLAYYTEDGQLIYAGRGGGGISREPRQRPTAAIGFAPSGRSPIPAVRRTSISRS
jgi:ATP-dependent DNA ligase